jgi:hypothetical protein
MRAVREFRTAASGGASWHLGLPVDKSSLHRRRWSTAVLCNEQSMSQHLTWLLRVQVMQKRNALNNLVDPLNAAGTPVTAAEQSRQCQPAT